ncbi:hypothetical protein AVEN_198746-1 [Araneus ventricosus]|uniref:Uncharacterized protein n=1 Tax=Araneus ventricosus TaxID=182803 RepID=A0A4Y2VPN4_ARAVE|nr:hypothetical protein AVEN_198746-1 [Araneus ventricosus]
MEFWKGRRNAMRHSRYPIRMLLQPLSRSHLELLLRLHEAAPLSRIAQVNTWRERSSLNQYVTKLPDAGSPAEAARSGNAQQDGTNAGTPAEAARSGPAQQVNTWRERSSLNQYVTKLPDAAGSPAEAARSGNAQQDGTSQHLAGAEFAQPTRHKIPQMQELLLRPHEAAPPSKSTLGGSEVRSTDTSPNSQMQWIFLLRPHEAATPSRMAQVSTGGSGVRSTDTSQNSPDEELLLRQHEAAPPSKSRFGGERSSLNQRHQTPRVGLPAEAARSGNAQQDGTSQHLAGAEFAQPTRHKIPQMQEVLLRPHEGPAQQVNTWQERSSLNRHVTKLPRCRISC